MEQALIEYMLNALWQVPVTAGGAWLLIRAVQPGPQMQHRLWLAVLGIAVLLPLRGMGNANGTAPLPKLTASVSTPIGTQHSSRFSFEQPQRWHFLRSPCTMHVRAVYARWLARLYLASVVLGLLQFARAWHASRRLVDQSRATQAYAEALANAGQRLGVRLPQVRESAGISSPMVVGAIDPVLLLPLGFDRFTEDEVRAVLCHELAHIRRKDFLVNGICQLAALPVVWHPAVYAVKQRIHMTREMICDAVAAEEMESKIGYAKCLLTLAHSMLASRSAGSEAQVLGLFSNHPLEERMRRLTETNRPRVRRQVARIAAGTTMMVAAAVAAAVLHVTPTMAQASAPPRATQNSPAGPVAGAATVLEGEKAPASPRSAARRPRAERTQRLQTEGSQQDVAKMKSLFDSPQFTKQMEDARKQASDMKSVFDSPQFKQQMEDAQKQASNMRAVFDSPQFKQQMEDAQKQASNMKAVFDSPQFKQQMEDAQKQASNMKAIFDSPQFKQQMEDAQKQAFNMKAVFDSPQFEQQMEDARRQAAKAQMIFDNPEFKRQIDEMQKELEKR